MAGTVSKYDHIKQRLRAGLAPLKQASEPMESWDPFNHQGPTEPLWPQERMYLIHARTDETPYERKLRMLRQLSQTCWACSMCELGRQYADRPPDPVSRDPHCFSNMNPTRFMVVGQNPGWEELRNGTPFVGPAGENFNNALAIGGLSRDDFYICNSIRCLTPQNQRPTVQQLTACEPFLRMELTLIKPLLVVALGGAAFHTLCPAAEFMSGLCRITRSELYDVPVFAVYHPSPLNLQDEYRATAFHQQMQLLCRLVKKLKGANPEACMK